MEMQRQENEMKKYLFNVQTTYEVIASSKEQAQEMLDNNNAELKDRDTLLVEVTDNG
jgi:hypothetical protein